LVPELHRDVPEFPWPTERALLQVLLIEADTGILRVIRAVTISPEMTAFLREAIHAQYLMSFDHTRYDVALQRVYQRYTDTDAMFAAAQVQCIAGRG
jgi:hypothetical protein